MARSTVDNRRIRNIFAIICHHFSTAQSKKVERERLSGNDVASALTYKNRPEIDENKKRDICELLQWEDVRKNMIRYTLGKAVQRMESVARIRSGHNPLMMRFMQRLVDHRMVQTPVDPVDEEVREADEKGELDNIVERERCVRGRIVKFGVTADFAEEERGGEDGHEGKGDQGLFDLEANLVLEVFGVGEGCVVEDEEVRDGGADEVDDGAEKPQRGSDEEIQEA